jgi:hypothetical protein
MRAARPDVVLSALYLPDRSGTELLTAMRADPLLKHVAFILISSETRPQALDPIRQSGVCGIVPKPFTSHQLTLALNATVDYLGTNYTLDNQYDLESVRVLLVDDSQRAQIHAPGARKPRHQPHHRSQRRQGRRCGAGRHDGRSHRYRLQHARNGWPRICRIRAHPQLATLGADPDGDQRNQREPPGRGGRSRRVGICDKPFEPSWSAVVGADAGTEPRPTRPRANASTQKAGPPGNGRPCF